MEYIYMYFDFQVGVRVKENKKSSFYSMWIVTNTLNLLRETENPQLAKRREIVSIVGGESLH